MNEQKFTRAQDASFVNPYHGNSEQLYTPVDMSSLGESLMKVGSETVKSLQASAFRQGQIDQLAKNVDDNRFLFKDTYLKGALYSKTQNDIQISAGKAQDIVNRAIANGDTAENVQDAIIESQSGIFEAAHQIAEVNPQAADNIVASLQNIQGSSLHNYQTQLVTKRNENIVRGDWQSINATLSHFMELVDSGETVPSFDNEMFHESVANLIGSLKTNATIMGVDPDTYVGDMIHNTFSGVMASAFMDNPKHVALVNSIVPVARDLAAKGIISPSASTNIQTVAMNKRSEAGNYAVAKLTELADEYTPITENNDKLFKDLVEISKTSGINPVTVTQLEMKYRRKHNVAMDAKRNISVGSLFPHGGTKEQQKAFRDDIDVRVDALRANGMSEQDILMNKIDMYTQATDIVGAKKYCEALEQEFLSEMGDGGSDATAGDINPMLKLFEWSQGNPHQRRMFLENFSARTKAFVLNNAYDYAARVERIMNDDTLKDEDKKKAIMNAKNVIREKWKLVGADSATGGSGGGSSGSSGYIVGNSLIASSESLGKGMNTFYSGTFGKGMGKTGWNKDLINTILPEFKSNIGRMSQTFRANHMTDITENEYNAMVSAKMLYTGTTGHTLISPSGDSSIELLFGTNPNAVAMAKTISDLASARTFQNGAKGKYDSDQSMLMINTDGTVSRLHVAVGGELSQKELISYDEVRATYNNNLKNVNKDHSEAIGRIFNDGFTFDEAGVDYSEYEPNPNAPLVPEKLPEGYDRKREQAKAELQFRRKASAALDKTLKLMAGQAEPMLEVGKQDMAESWEALNDPKTTKEYIKNHHPLMWEYLNVPPEKLWEWQVSKINLSAGGHDNYWEAMFQSLFGRPKAKKEVVYNEPTGTVASFRTPMAFETYDEDSLSYVSYIKSRMYGDVFDGSGIVEPQLLPWQRDMFKNFFDNPEVYASSHYNDILGVVKDTLPDYTAVLRKHANFTAQFKNINPMQPFNNTDTFTFAGRTRGSKNTFYVTGAIDKSVFGPSLGRELIGVLGRHEGFILNWTATNPKVTPRAVIGLGYLDGGYPTFQEKFEAAAGSAEALSVVTCEFITMYYSKLPEKFKEHVGREWNDVLYDDDAKRAILGCADYMWHAGANATAYLRAMKMIDNSNMDGAINFIKGSAAYAQSGPSRKKYLLDGLAAYQKYVINNPKKKK